MKFFKIERIQFLNVDLMSEKQLINFFTLIGQEVMEEERRDLNEKIFNDPISFLQLDLNIIQNSTLPQNVIENAAVYFGSVFKSLYIFTNFENQWKSAPNEIIKNIIESSFSLIGHPFLMVRHQAAFACAQISFKIKYNPNLLEQFKKIITRILELFSSQSIFEHHGGILLLEETLNMSIPSSAFSSLSPGIISSLLSFLIFPIQSTLSAQNPDNSVEMRLECIKCLSSFIQSIPEIFDQSFIFSLLSVLPFSFPIPDLRLFSAIHNLMFVIFTSKYSIMSQFIDSIMKYTFISLKMENPDYLCVVLSFINDLAAHEALIIYKSKMEMKNSRRMESHSNNDFSSYLSPYCSNLIEIILQILKSSSISSFDNLSQSLFGQALLAIKSIAIPYPSTILLFLSNIAIPHLNKFIQNPKDFRNSYIEINTELLLLSSLFDNSNFAVAFNQVNSIDINYIQTCCRILLSIIHQKENISLLDSSYNILSMLLETFPDVIGSENGISFSDFFDIVMIITPNLPDFIYKDQAQLLFFASKSKLITSDIAVKFYCLAVTMSNMSYNEQSTQTYVIRNVTEAINHIIENLIQTIQNKSFIEQVFTETFKSIKILAASFSTSTILICQLISILNQICLNGFFPSLEHEGQFLHIVDVNALEAMEFVIQLIHGPYGLEPESIYALSAFLRYLNSSLTEDMIKILFEIGLSGITSKIPDVIIPSTILISDLYKYIGINTSTILRVSYEQVFSMVSQMILSNNNMDKSVDVVLSIILTNVIGAALQIENCDIRMEILDKNYETYYQIMKQLTEIPIEQTEDDLQFSETFYLYLANMYANYARAYHTNTGGDAEVARLKDLFKFMMKISDTVGYESVNDNEAFSIIKMLKYYAIGTTRQNNIFLNKGKITRFLIICQKNPSLCKKVQEEAKQTYNIFLSI